MPICHRLKESSDFYPGQNITVIDGNESRRQNSIVLRTKTVIFGVSSSWISYYPVYFGKKGVLTQLEINSLQIIAEEDVSFYKENIETFLIHIRKAVVKPRKNAVDKTLSQSNIRTVIQKVEEPNPTTPSGAETMAAIPQKRIDYINGLFIIDGLRGFHDTSLMPCSAYIDSGRLVIILKTPLLDSDDKITTIPDDNHRFMSLNQARDFAKYNNIDTIIDWLKSLTFIGKSPVCIDHSNNVDIIEPIKWVDEVGLERYARQLLCTLSRIFGL